MKARLALALCVLLQTESSDLRWPFGRGNKAYPLRATYGQLEGTDASFWLPHWGLDILGSVKRQTVYAIEEGTVIGIRDDSDETSAVLVESKRVTGHAFLYLHMDRCSIDVVKDQEIQVGKRLGRIAKTNSGTGEPHLHLARLGGDYRNHDWAGLSSLSVANPLRLLKKGDKGDHVGPTLVAFPNSKLVALRDDDDGATGWKDVVVRAYDTDFLSTHLLAPRKLKLSITSEGGSTIDFRPIAFDAALVKSELEGVYDFSPGFRSAGDTSVKKYDYYFVLTNTGQEGTGTRAWEPTPGVHHLHVEVEDARGYMTPLNEQITYP